jgi:hypothetical protein
MIRSVQTVQLSCVKISTIVEWSELGFHLSLVTKEYHRVCAKRLLSLWYFQRKTCTYLASSLALAPNELNQAST